MEPDYFNNDEYLTIRSCGIRSFTTYCNTLAELESYKKRNNRYRKYKRNLGVLLEAAVTDRSCNVDKKGIDRKDKNRSELESNITLWGLAGDGYSYRAQLGTSISGSFTYGGRNTTYVLQ